jgi:hypothetical protein
MLLFFSEISIMMDEYRETVGIFMEKGFYRQAESQYLMVPPQRCKQLHLIPAQNYVYLVIILFLGTTI